MAIPLSLAGLVSAFAGGARSGDAPRWGRVAAWATTAVLLVLGLALTRSRSGVLLGAVGALACLPMLLALRRRRAAGRVLGAMLAIGLVMLVQFGLFGLVQRLNTDPLGDHRWQIAALTAEGARAHAPLGSGLGTFRQVFGALDVDAPGDTIVNHAHDDYLELWLEAGWPFLAVAGAFALLFGWTTVRMWRAGGIADDPWPHAAWASLVLVLLHSALDYPLRTTAIQACFGLLLALLMAHAWPGRSVAPGALPRPHQP
jgi:O-antigen ligase